MCRDCLFVIFLGLLSLISGEARSFNLPIADNLKLSLDSHVEIYQGSDKNANQQDQLNPITLDYRAYPAENNNNATIRAKGYGRVKSPFWIRFRLHNTLPQARQLFIELANPLVEQAILVEHKNNELKQLFETGLSYPSSTRAVKTGTYIFPVYVQAKTEQTYYLYLYSPNDAFFPLRIYDHIGVVNELFARHMQDLLFFGIMNGMFLYNLVVFIKTRLRLYLSYLALTFTTGIVYLGSRGYIYLLWPHTTAFNDVVCVAMPVISAVTLLIFFQLFFETKQRYPKTSKIVWGFCIYSLVIAVWLLFDIPQWILEWCYMYPALTLVYLILRVIIKELQRGFAPAKYFLAGILMPLFIGISRVLWASGLILLEGPLQFLMTQGEVIQVLIFSLGMMAFVRELDRRKETSMLLAEEAHIIDKEKNAFVSRMSREIRIPMNGLIGAVELLKLSNIGEQGRKLNGIIEDSAKSLLKIIDDIVTMTAKDSADITLDADDLDLTALLASIEQLFSGKTIETGVSLNFDLDNSIPLKLTGDGARLRQVLINLIGNAFKFTAQGCVSVRVETVKCETDNRLVENRLVENCLVGNCLVKFSVIDTGLGISTEQQAKLFQSFAQADQSISRQYGGTGLGLVICKKIVKLMQGEIGVTSNVGQGSEFWFTASFQVAHRQELRLDQNEKRFSTVMQNDTRLVLLGETDIINQRVTRGLLEELGFNVQVFNDGEKLWQAFLQQRPRVKAIVLESYLELKNGLDVTRLIREVENNNQWPPVLIVCATCQVMGREKALAFDAGIDRFLAKPITIAALADAISDKVVEQGA